jgi:hypothetical protein
MLDSEACLTPGITIEPDTFAEEEQAGAPA